MRVFSNREFACDIRGPNPGLASDAVGGTLSLLLFSHVPGVVAPRRLAGRRGAPWRRGPSHSPEVSETGRAHAPCAAPRRCAEAARRLPGDVGGGSPSRRRCPGAASHSGAPGGPNQGHRRTTLATGPGPPWDGRDRVGGLRRLCAAGAHRSVPGRPRRILRRHLLVPRRILRSSWGTAHDEHPRPRRSTEAPDRLADRRVWDRRLRLGLPSRHLGSPSSATSRLDGEGGRAPCHTNVSRGACRAFHVKRAAGPAPMRITLPRPRSEARFTGRCPRMSTWQLVHG